MWFVFTWIEEESSLKFCVSTPILNLDWEHAWHICMKFATNGEKKMLKMDEEQ